MADLTVTSLRDGYVARPEGRLGTCGFHPYPWEAVWGETACEAIRRFTEAHREFLSLPVTANYD